VFALIPNVTQILGLLLIKPLRRWNFLRPLASFVFAAMGVVIGFWCFMWIVAHTSLRVAVMMVVLPAALSFFNGRERIKRAVKGVSGVRQMLRAQGEEGAYDQQSDVQTEYGYLYGDMVGYVVGIFLFIHRETWFWP
jgi:hypothetical protein